MSTSQLTKPNTHVVEAISAELTRKGVEIWNAMQRPEGFQISKNRHWDLPYFNKIESVAKELGYKIKIIQLPTGPRGGIRYHAQTEK
ncbi:MAG: hypothetical protein WC054_03995 [Candidatus Nanopelagicales bacterium]